MKSTELRRILVPIDFSLESEKTLRFAKSFAAHFGARLHLVHVVTPPIIFPPRRMGLPFAYSEKGIATRARKRMQKLVSELSTVRAERVRAWCAVARRRRRLLEPRVRRTRI
jgi:nucleotide-binding universal stress UspA family protein